jgi:ABC-2 type transport system ATP-binding protein
MASEAVLVSSVEKSFGETRALKGVSFEARSGEILAVLGPNGAGKTTAIRILMGIFPQDSGEVKIFGEHFSEGTKKIVGYLPEERGLYTQSRVLETLVYLASLKGMDGKQAESEARRLLSELGLAGVEEKKINELSKGMQQKVQFIATILHKPRLLVLDEPFSGLDPINTNTVKNMILALKERGTAIIFSTHIMEQAEKMADRVLMINKGERVLYGTLQEIKAGHGKASVKVTYSGALPKAVPGVAAIDDYGSYAELKLEKATDPADVLKALVSAKARVSGFEASEPSLNEIFIDSAEASSR